MVCTYPSWQGYLPVMHLLCLPRFQVLVMHYSLTDSNFVLENLASIRLEQLLFERRIKTVLSKMRQSWQTGIKRSFAYLNVSNKIFVLFFEFRRKVTFNWLLQTTACDTAPLIPCLWKKTYYWLTVEREFPLTLNTILNHAFCWFVESSRTP